MEAGKVSAFIPILRSSFLYLSKQGWLRRWIETSDVAQRFTSRFIAGLDLDAALRVARRLHAEGTLVSLDYLGENVHFVEEATQARDAYLTAQHRVADAGLPATVSVKATALGLDLSKDICRENLDSLVRKAQQTGSLVEMDMESSEYTDRTLDLVHEMHSQYGSVRAVIQAYLYRSERDIRLLNEKRIPVRLCKGAYKEPPSIAYASKAEVDSNYRKLMYELLKNGTYPALATHDESIIRDATAFARKEGIAPDQFEFQMLYGIRRDLQQKLLQEGWRLRLYVPYGTAWYPYFMRRLAERPANILFIMRNLLR
jgi:proline dehydrogenase